MSQQGITEAPDARPQDREWSSDEFCEEHQVLTVRLVELREVAERMPSLSPREACERLERVCGLVAGRFVPHVRAEYEHHAHLATRDHRPIPGQEQEAEIERLARRLVETWETVPDTGTAPLHTMRGLLFDLHTLLRLHFEAGC